MLFRVTEDVPRTSTANQGTNAFVPEPVGKTLAPPPQELARIAKYNAWLADYNPSRGGPFSFVKTFVQEAAPMAIAIAGGWPEASEFVAIDTTAPTFEESGMFDWLSSGWDQVTNFFGGSSVADDASAQVDPWNAEPGWDQTVIDETPGTDGTWARLEEAGTQIFSDTPGGGNIVPLPGVQQAGVFSAVGGPVIAAGARTLATLFGAGAGRAATFVINGIRGTVPQLWKYTRKYGPQAVSSALGISVGALGTMLMQNPERPHRRRRGISGRDIRTTKRVVRFVSRMAHDIGCVHAPRHFTARRRGRSH